MTRSDQINELATAMAQAQAEMEGAERSATNPHFRSAYATLASVREASLPPLNKHGIAVFQLARLVHGGEDMWLVEVETQLVHSSGQFIGDTLAVPVTKVDAQGVGSALTYARRYSLGAIAGVAPEDDDGEAAVGRPDPAKQPAAAGAMETATVKVLGIMQRPTTNGKAMKYIVTGSDQKTYSTIKEAQAIEAKRAQEAGLSVDIVYKTTQFGRDIVGLAESKEPAL